MEEAQEQENIREKRIEQLRPYQYKKGQSGNPSGRPVGISLKEYARNKLLTMTDEEREEFFYGLPKDKIWEMAEGKAKQDTEISGEVKQIITTINVIAPAHGGNLQA
jgi:hypothetical protein